MGNAINTGSFGAGLGDVSALKAAMSRRGIDAGILDQVSAAAPGPNTPVAPPLPADAGQIAPAPTPEETAASVGPLKPTVRTGEMEIALNAMKGVIDTENKIARATLVGI